MILQLATVWNGIAVYATDTGLIFSLSNHRGLLLKKSNTIALGVRNRKYRNRHYEKISIGTYLGVKMIFKNLYVHRLVAQAFISPPPFPKAQVDHINRDRWDNRPSNLRWVTAKENFANSSCHRDAHGSFIRSPTVS